MREFRRHARSLAPSPGASALGSLVSTATAPWRALKTARAGVRRYGHDIAAVSGVPRWRQAAELWWLRLRYDADALSYRDYQLYRPERRARVSDYLSKRDFMRIIRHLTAAYAAESDGGRIRDKRAFTEWCAGHGLPHVPVLAEWKDGTLVYDARPGGALPAADLFSKPPDATYGSGTARWAYDGRGGYGGRDGRVRDAEVLLVELAERSRVGTGPKDKRSHRMLLMPCLQNDPVLAPITAGALCTVRIVTYQAPGRPAAFLVATYKMATGDAPADNFHFGGMLAAVDPDTGRLGAAVRQRGRALTAVDRHPDSGAVIAGFPLPHWRAARALAVRAHESARFLPMVGWDIALTPDGPVLIEGNTWGNPDIMQAPTGRPLGDTPYIAALNAHMRAVAARRRA